MIISISRFTWENLDLDVASGGTQTFQIQCSPTVTKQHAIDLDVWCTAELCVALIVVSLPSLKTLLKDRPHVASQSASDAETGSGSVALVRPRGGEMEIYTQVRNSWYKQV
jgi:hypothetical protein